MLRRIIKINEDLCDGCGLCAAACHEGAIGMVEGKAKLLRDDYCDGLGDCLPACPTGAITFEEREAAPYDEAAVKARLAKMGRSLPPSGCPGSNAHAIRRGTAHPVPASSPAISCPSAASASLPSRSKSHPAPTPVPVTERESQLMQWPVQIKLVPVNAPYFDGAHLLVAADCAAYAYAGFHEQFMRNKITIIGCPKLDEGDYSEKLTAILQQNRIKSVTVVRMEVPGCGGIQNAVIRALQNSGKMIPWQVVTLSTDGRIIEDI